MWDYVFYTFSPAHATPSPNFQNTNMARATSPPSSTKEPIAAPIRAPTLGPRSGGGSTGEPAETKQNIKVNH